MCIFRIQFEDNPVNYLSIFDIWKFFRLNYPQKTQIEYFALFDDV